MTNKDIDKIVLLANNIDNLSIEDYNYLSTFLGINDKKVLTIEDKDEQSERIEELFRNNSSKIMKSIESNKECYEYFKTKLNENIDSLVFLLCNCSDKSFLKEIVSKKNLEKSSIGQLLTATMDEEFMLKFLCSNYLSKGKQIPIEYGIPSIVLNKLLIEEAIILDNLTQYLNTIIQYQDPTVVLNALSGLDYLFNIMQSVLSDDHLINVGAEQDIEFKVINNNNNLFDIRDLNKWIYSTLINIANILQLYTNHSELPANLLETISEKFEAFRNKTMQAYQYCLKKIHGLTLDDNKVEGGDRDGI